MTKKEKYTTPLCQEAGIKLIHFQPNKINPDGRARDCTVRALCRLENKDWEYIYRLLYENSVSIGDVFNTTRNLQSVLEKMNYERIKPPRGTSIARFIIDNRYGKYFICSEKHAIACINSKIYDTNFVHYDAFVSASARLIYRKK